MIIVETGEIVENANSYVLEEEAQEILSLRGKTYEGSLQESLVSAIDYLQTRESELKGERTEPEQPLSFPRKHLWVYQRELDKNEIPIAIKMAQVFLAYEIKMGIDMAPVVTESSVKSEKVGPLETEYFGEAPTVPVVKSVENLLKELTIWGGRPFGVMSFRV